MKLVNAELFLEIDIQENMPAVLVLESPDMMTLVVKELYDISYAGEGNFVLSLDNKVLSMEKTAEIIINPFNVDFNTRKIQSKLYEELIEGGNIYVEEKSMIQSLTIDYLDKLIQNVSYEMITSNIELDLLRLFKMYDVRLEPQCNSILETLIEYTKVLSRLLRKKFLILINICNYLDVDAVKELAHMCAYQKLNLLFIERRETDFQFPVKTYIIDKDKCLIIK